MEMMEWKEYPYADRVSVTTIVDNYLDFLLPNEENVERLGIAKQFDPDIGPLQADNGICYLVEVEKGSKKNTILMEAGYEASVVLHNMSALRVNPGEIECVVISHGHPDHVQGLEGVLIGIRERQTVKHRIPVYIHKDAFYPRYVVTPSGETIGPFNRSILEKSKLEEAGAMFISTKNPIPIAPGTYVSGEIPRTEEFVPKTPSRTFYVKNGLFQEDKVLDDQALIINLKKGLILLTGCSHYGVVNGIRHAQRIAGQEKVLAVIGGTHLGFPGVQEEMIGRTMEELKKIGPILISPTHCTGFSAQLRIAKEMPKEYFVNTVGTKITFE